MTLLNNVTGEKILFQGSFISEC